MIKHAETREPIKIILKYKSNKRLFGCIDLGIRSQILAFTSLKFYCLSFDIYQ